MLLSVLTGDTSQIPQDLFTESVFKTITSWDGVILLIYYSLDSISSFVVVFPEFNYGRNVRL